MDVLHYLQILLLALVEGLTEFLPVSATSHLLIVESVLKVHQTPLFGLAIEAGAVLAALFALAGRISEIIGNSGDREIGSYALKIIMAVLITSAVGFVVQNHGPLTIEPVAWMLFIGGLVILIVEYLASGLLPREEVTWLEAIAIGVAQAFAAIFPEASRPGCTIMMGLLMGLKRAPATEFSFFIGIPTLTVSIVYQLAKLIWNQYQNHPIDLNGETISQVSLDCILGFAISGVAAFLAVRWLLRFIQYNTYNGFGIYRVILGGGLLVAINGQLFMNSVQLHSTISVQSEIQPPLVSDPVPTPQTNRPPSLPPDTEVAVPALPVTPEPSSTPSPTLTPTETPTPTPNPSPTPSHRHHRHTITPVPYVFPTANPDQ